MSTYVRRKKLKECDMSGTCGGDAGMSAIGVSDFSSDTAIGMGNVIPPSEGRIGSGDNFNALTKGIATKSGFPSVKGSRYTIRKKKSKKSKK